jgi:hypothetical protein
MYGQNVVTELGTGDQLSLQLLTAGWEIRSTAPAMLANHFTCQTIDTGERPGYFAPSRNFVSYLLIRAPTRASLPHITTYARRPVYDDGFVLCGPGYHARQQILVHGLDVDPVTHVSVPASQPIRDRLPPYVRALFSGFCFRDPADVANALAAMVTGVLSNHFVQQPKATIGLDANQAGLGKTWFALAVGGVLDGQLPDLIHYTSEDEELAKRLLANLLQRPTSILLVDNAKNRGGAEINSPCIEANSMAPNITLRILGKSSNYTQPNDVLWFLTMNQTKLSSDLSSRQLPIRFFYEGDPISREFSGPNPLQYAIVHRAEILAELFGLVEFWKSRGQPRGSQRHRCDYWAEVVGGILEVCGFPEFLENATEAAAAFNSELGDLAALAERVIRNRKSAAYTMMPDPLTRGSNG